MDMPIQVLPFWTYAADSRISRIITGITKSAFSHTGIAFRFADGRCEYFEALLSDGFNGPKDGHKLTVFGLQPGNRLQILPLSASEDNVAGMYLTAMAMRGAGYNTVQLLSIALSERYGVPVPLSPNKMICSEAHARILYPFYDVRDLYRPRFEAVTPQSAWVRHLEIRAGFNPSATTEKENISC